MTFRWVPGALLAAVGAAAGYGVHALLPGLPWLTASLILGVLAGCIPPWRPALDGVLKPGLGIASRRLLRIGIVVLGLKLSLGDIAKLGWLAIVLIVALVAASFVITWGIGRLFRLEGDQAVLMAAGFSICGVSAVGAMSAARRSDEKDTGTPIALVTLYGTLAIVVLPPLAGLIGLSTSQFGHWVGASVHDVGQVVATAQTMGAAALAVAIVVKLTRVLMLAPMVAIASIQTRRRAVPEPAEGRPLAKNPPIVPLFIVGFLAAVLIRTVVPLPDGVLAAADVLQSALLAAALFAIGASLRLE
ncbi:MAG: putative sulfate exporter family transporter, partial [Actinomycetota bacterium]